MKLVLLFFCAILILFFVIIFSRIRLNVKKIYISNIENGKKTRDFNKNFLIYIEIYLLGIIKIARIKVKKEWLEKLKENGKKKSWKEIAFMMKKFEILNDLKKLNARIKNIDMDIEIGTENINLTVYAVAIISSLLRNSI